MFKLNRFADVITNFDQLNRIQIYCYYFNTDGNLESFTNGDTPEYDGYIDDMPYRFLTTDYRIPTEKEMEIITEGNADRPFSIFIKEEEGSMSKPVLEVYLICID